MDNFLIKNLEFFMNKLSFSPYTAARSLVMASLLIWISFHWKGIHETPNVFYFQLIGFSFIASVLYSKTHVPELMNKKGFTNVFKENRKYIRLTSIILLFLFIVVPGLDINIRTDSLFILFIFFLYEYLIALEWTRSVNHLSKRWIAFRVMSRARRKARLKRKLD